MKLASLFYCGLALVSLGLTGCDVDVNDPGKMPDVSVTPGRAPDVDVRGPDVDVTTKESTATVPDIDVDTKEVPVTVPEVDVTLPAENDNE